MGASQRAHRRRSCCPACRPARGCRRCTTPDYEPIWAVCEELDMPVNHHGGSGRPDCGMDPERQVIFLLEVTWWAHRVLWHLIFGGVLERHPDLQLVFTEQGTGVGARVRSRSSTTSSTACATPAARRSASSGGAVVEEMSLTPSEYWARQCHVGRELHPPVARCRCATQVGVDRIMWGSDYPHNEVELPVLARGDRA